MRALKDKRENALGVGCGTPRASSLFVERRFRKEGG
jgi:hypothetical protein